MDAVKKPEIKGILLGLVEHEGEKFIALQINGEEPYLLTAEEADTHLIQMDMLLTQLEGEELTEGEPSEVLH